MQGASRRDDQYVQEGDPRLVVVLANNVFVGLTTADKLALSTLGYDARVTAIARKLAEYNEALLIPRDIYNLIDDAVTASFPLHERDRAVMDVEDELERRLLREDRPGQILQKLADEIGGL